jgi:hypothetical protein
MQPFLPFAPEKTLVSKEINPHGVIQKHQIIDAHSKSRVLSCAHFKTTQQKECFGNAHSILICHAARRPAARLAHISIRYLHLCDFVPDYFC